MARQPLASRLALKLRLYEAAFDGNAHPPLHRQPESVQAFYERLARAAQPPRGRRLGQESRGKESDDAAAA